MPSLPSVTLDYDRRQRGEVFLDEEQVWDGRRYAMSIRLADEPPPPAHVSAAHCIAFDGEDVVLVRHVTREWTIPGGRLEPGESSLQCVRREAREEAGIEIADERLVAINRIEMLDEAPADWPYPFPAYQVFYVARVTGWGEITAVDECTEARRFPVVDALAAPGWTQQNPAFAAALFRLRPSSS